MLNELYAHHGSVIFLGTLVCIVILGATFARTKPRKEKPDPPAIFGPIRGMYVCYQCDTVFNTIRCPNCDEDAVIPLVHLTGSIVQNDRIMAMTDRLQVRSTRKLPTRQNDETDRPAPTYRPEATNGGAHEVH
jgi:hypothetical protein